MPVGKPAVLDVRQFLLRRAASSEIGAPPLPASGPTSVDAGNPYAPTFTSPAIQPTGSSDWAPRQITYDEVFSKTWAIFKEQWLMTCARS